MQVKLTDLKKRIVNMKAAEQERRRRRKKDAIRAEVARQRAERAAALPGGAISSKQVLDLDVGGTLDLAQSLVSGLEQVSARSWLEWTECGRCWL